MPIAAACLVALLPERILEATEEVLRRHGPAKATVVDVARALGVSHGSVYRHFRTKAVLRRDESVTDQKLPKGIVRRIAGFARPYRTLLLTFLALIFADAALGVVNPLILRAIIDNGILGHDTTLIVDLALVPVMSAELWSAAIAIAIFGAVGWGLLVPQQHRLVTLAPSTAPVVLGLNTACTYLGVTTAGVVGAIGIGIVGPHNLPFIATGLCVVALMVSELASRRIGTTEAIAVPDGLLASH